MSVCSALKNGNESVEVTQLEIGLEKMVERKVNCYDCHNCHALIAKC